MKIKRKVSHSSTNRIAVILLISGVITLVFSMYSQNQVLAFIGLGLTFWGALFVFLEPQRLVNGSLLYNTSLSTYLTINRIIDDFNYKGEGYYIPPFPKDAYLPEYLKGLKASVVFISAKNDGEMPSIEEIAKGKFMSKGQKGVLVAPPGSGILSQIEETINVDFTKMTLDELCHVLPTFILQDLNLAKAMGLEPKGDQVHLKLFDSLYKDLYSSRNNLKSVNLLGCPIVSAVACAIAKNSGRNVTLQKQQVSPDGLSVEVWYHIIG